MKGTSKLRKMYMNINGILLTEQYAKDFYGDRFDSAIIAKVLVNKNGDVKGTWE